MKLAVDCSKPVDHPKHARLVSLTAAEKKQQAKDAKRPPKQVVDARSVAAEAIENAETLDDVKQALVDFLRGR